MVIRIWIAIPVDKRTLWDYICGVLLFLIYYGIAHQDKWRQINFYSNLTDNSLTRIIVSGG